MVLDVVVLGIEGWLYLMLEVASIEFENIGYLLHHVYYIWKREALALDYFLVLYRWKIF
jgi:hypothetical protein